MDQAEPQAGGQSADLAVTSEASATPAEQTVETTATPTEGAQVPAEGQQPEATPAAEQDTGSDRRDTKAERRIGKLTSRAKQAEETAATLGAENAALKQQLDGLQAPSDEDYGSAEHTAAVVRHATTEANIQGRLDANTREQGRLQLQQQQQLNADVSEKVEAFIVKTPDYSQSVSKIVSLQNLAGSVMQLENTPEVFYALSKDLNLAVALNNMPETQRLIELGRLSVEVTVKPVTVSKAPPPVESAQGGTAAAEGGPRDDMSMEEFNAWHDKRYGIGA